MGKLNFYRLCKYASLYVVYVNAYDYEWGIFIWIDDYAHVYHDAYLYDDVLFYYAF